MPDNISIKNGIFQISAFAFAGILGTAFKDSNFVSSIRSYVLPYLYKAVRLHNRFQMVTPSDRASRFELQQQTEKTFDFLAFFTPIFLGIIAFLCARIIEDRIKKRVEDQANESLIRVIEASYREYEQIIEQNEELRHILRGQQEAIKRIEGDSKQRNDDMRHSIAIAKVIVSPYIDNLGPYAQYIGELLQLITVPGKVVSLEEIRTKVESLTVRASITEETIRNVCEDLQTINKMCNDHPGKLGFKGIYRVFSGEANQIIHMAILESIVEEQHRVISDIGIEARSDLPVHHTFGYWQSRISASKGQKGEVSWQSRVIASRAQPDIAKEHSI